MFYLSQSINKKILKRMSNNELNEKLKLLIELYNRGKFQDVLSKGNTIKSKFPKSLQYFFDKF